MINLPESKRVLICPLDWGLGHASRTIPVIKELLKAKNEVIIAADKLPLNLLKEEFPELESVKFPSFQISYPRGKFLVFKLLIQSPKILFGIIKEHKHLKKLIAKSKADIIISDNRFGCWNKKIKSIYITHQVMVKMPKGFQFIEYFGYLIHRFFINKYDECWIPDWEGKNNLSGDLSHKYKTPVNAHFISPLSRFDGEQNHSLVKKYDIVCILSGPEPQRTIFEEILISQISKSNFKAIIVRGQPGKITLENSTNIEFVNHLPTKQMAETIQQSKLVICRSGYSSIMDLVALNKKAILVPTPGQTEQEYLAEHLKNHKLFEMVKQDEYSITKVINIIKGNTQ